MTATTLRPLSQEKARFRPFAFGGLCYRRLALGPMTMTDRDVMPFTVHSAPS